jgi:hypothetical protein
MHVGKFAASPRIAWLSEADVASVVDIPPSDGADGLVLDAELPGDRCVGHAGPHEAAWSFKCQFNDTAADGRYYLVPLPLLGLYPLASWSRRSYLTVKP